MQRILSGERASGCTDISEEFVTKRLCISIIIVFAFFSLLGGFFLGRYANEKVMASTSRKAAVQFEMLNQLSQAINKISNLTAAISHLPASRLAARNYDANKQVRCNNSSAGSLTDYNSDVKKINDVILSELYNLRMCYNNVTHFLEIILAPD